MNICVAGSRTIDDIEVVRFFIRKALRETGWKLTKLVSGHARGVDRLAEELCRDAGIPIMTFPVTPEEWERLGKAAGHIRNRRMAKYLKETDGAAIILWDGESKGAWNMWINCGELAVPYVLFNFAPKIVLLDDDSSYSG